MVTMIRIIICILPMVWLGISSASAAAVTTAPVSATIWGNGCEGTEAHCYSNSNTPLENSPPVRTGLKPPCRNASQSSSCCLEDPDCSTEQRVNMTSNGVGCLYKAEVNAIVSDYEAWQVAVFNHHTCIQLPAGTVVDVEYFSRTSNPNYGNDGFLQIRVVSPLKVTRYGRKQVQQEVSWAAFDDLTSAASEDTLWTAAGWVYSSP